ncbi:MAG TPA: EAL domain-containing protein [Pyrinomonadaceae bacterium]|nr:EAL domain-containing protein [Pyrinomonadaceae bacterium]
MSQASKQQLARRYMWTVIAVGTAACLFTLLHLRCNELGLRFILLALITLGLGSRIVVQIPKVKGKISVSDTFILLTILLFGGEAAILLAAADAFTSSLRITKHRLIVAFNTSVFVCSTFITVWTLRFLFGPVEKLSAEGYTSKFITALCVMAFVQYVTNSGLVAVGVALKAAQPLWKMWRENFLWTSITYFAGASAAGIIAKLVALLGIYAFLATAPIIAIVYFTYCTYLKNIEASTRQVELAQQHAEQVQQHMIALRDSEERFRNAFDYATIGMAVVALDGSWLQVNRSLCEIVGYSETELLRGNFADITHKDDLGVVLGHIEQLANGNLNSYQAEQRYTHKRGHDVCILLGASVVHDTQGAPLHLIFQIQDITNRKRAEEQLLYDAFHDALTGLPNRALFADHVKMAIQRARRNSGKLFSILFLDLDRFNVVNDSLGHLVGDRLLVDIARRLETCLRPGDTVARLGGDEFTILLEDLEDVCDAVEVAMRVQEAVSQPYQIEGHDVFTTASIGIAPSSGNYDNAEEILRDADTAMYRAKSLGKNRHEVFDKVMHDRAMRLLQLETDLRRAVEREEFSLNYQPIISLETGKIAGFEALVRWNHPADGFISPAEFIPIAEETGLIIPLGTWVLREACRQMRAWMRADELQRPLTISVNLSSKQFTQPDLIEQVAAILRETELPATCLKFEITESMVMENVETAIHMLSELRALGVELSIDDFGTGYSSLSYLHRFPINTLKIDRSFVMRMTDNAENGEIVRTIITLARSLDMNVVAEGVETQAQLEQLRMLDCDFGQGYIFSRPVGIEAASRLLDDINFYDFEAAAQHDGARVLAA